MHKFKFTPLFWSILNENNTSFWGRIVPTSITVWGKIVGPWEEYTSVPLNFEIFWFGENLDFVRHPTPILGNFWKLFLLYLIVFVVFTHCVFLFHIKYRLHSKGLYTCSIGQILLHNFEGGRAKHCIGIYNHA